MATGDNPVQPLFEPSNRVTVVATAAVGAGRFVKPSGNFQGGPLLDLTGPTTPLVGGNLIQCAQCVAGDKAIGVALYDASGNGEPFPCAMAHFILPVVAGGAIAAGNEVQSDANGAAIVLAAGKANGIAVSAAAGGVVYIKMYS